ncbi:tRNA lysidine(34) synthetase TilS [Deinococcus altitudinis]|uniref:tRNA lysidine(34) synthetase TilS n=1 Tax=Deinococcus altitudinis TaxID=468914 RepID=UPI003891691D
MNETDRVNAVARRVLTPLEPYRDRPLLVAVSGGADSVALLRALVQVGARPQVGHLDHALRPESADDAAFVAGLAAELNLPFFGERIDVARIAEQRGWNLEEAARRLRYTFLTRTAKAAGLRSILTAHTRSDQTETVLWQFLRGEAVLGGMPGRAAHVERPWLEVGRDEVLAYLGTLGQTWREDSSNADTRFTRNWIRREVLPLLQSRFPALERTLPRLARFQAQDDAALRDQAERLGDHTPYARLPLAVLRRYARHRLAGVRVQAGHLEQVAQALQQGQTLHLTLPGDLPLTVTGGQLFRGESGSSRPEFPRPQFAYPAHWTLRHRLPADRIRLPAGGRKLSDLLTDLKLPRDWRDDLWLLADEGAVKWMGLPAAATWNRGTSGLDTPRPVWAEGAAAQAGQEPAPDPEWLAMGEALGLARQAAQAGEVPIGAVVLHGGRVIAGAANRCRELGDLTRHAELDALRSAARLVGPYLNECTLVVTLEPCPMCLGAALEARVAGIVYAAPNLKAGALGGVSDLLGHHWGHRPQVRPGLRAAESARLLRQMFAGVRSDAPQSVGPTEAGGGEAE